MTVTENGIADYLFLEGLGRGSHGRVFLAQPPERLSLGNALTAVKVLDKNATDQEFRRVATELRVFSALSSDYLVQLYDVGYQGGSLYYSMAYYPDGSLAVPAHDLSLGDRIQIVADAARGAHALHSVGVVHRDIKPENVMIDGQRGRLADVGLAQILSPGLTSTGMGPIASIEFMEPQVIWGEQASRATDIWSLGMTLHKVLTSVSMFGAIPDGNVASSFQHVLHHRPEAAPNLPVECRSILKRCTAEERAERYRSAADLADDLDAIQIKDGPP